MKKGSTFRSLQKVLIEDPCLLSDVTTSVTKRLVKTTQKQVCERCSRLSMTKAEIARQAGSGFFAVDSGGSHPSEQTHGKTESALCETEAKENGTNMNSLYLHLDVLID